MCHGKYKEKPQFKTKKEGKKRVPYSRVKINKQFYEYSEDQE